MINTTCAPANLTFFTDDKSQCSDTLVGIPNLLRNYDRSKPSTPAVGKYIGIIGSRQLPAIYKEKVKRVVELLLQKGYDIASGGAIGADNYALESLLELAAAHRGLIFSPWQEIDQFPEPARENVKMFIDQGGQVIWGDVPRNAARQTVVAGLLGRNVRLVSGAVGLIAFPFGEARGTAFTLRQAQQKKIPCLSGRQAVRIFQLAHRSP